MSASLPREHLIGLARKIIRGEGTEYENAAWRQLIDRVVFPVVGELFDHIFSGRYGLGDNPTAAAIVDKALGSQPMQL